MSRVILITSFILLIGASIVITTIALTARQWETVTASISLLIAIVSAWISFETLHRQDQTNRPQLVLGIDFHSRTGLIQLVCQNAGGKPAFNIKIDWDRDLVNTNGKKITFSKFHNDVDIPVLNPKETTAAFVDGENSFFEKFRGQDLTYSGKISYQESLNRKQRTSTPFSFSLTHYSNTLLDQKEETLTMNRLQKIPDALKAIASELTSIRKLLNDQNK